MSSEKRKVPIQHNETVPTALLRQKVIDGEGQTFPTDLQEVLVPGKRNQNQ
jgi:hypothetical protein